MTHKQLKQLVNDFHDDAYLWSKQCVGGSSEDAREILQIVYLKILEEKARYGGRSSIKTWLFSIIRYTAIDFIKKRNGSIETQSIDIKSIDIALADKEESIPYINLLYQLSDKQRQVLLLVFYHDMTLEEVAKTMTTSIGTVRQHYARGKRKLKLLIIQRQNIHEVKHYG